MEGTYVYDNIFGLKKDKIFLEKEYDEKSKIVPLIFIYFLQWNHETFIIIKYFFDNLYKKFYYYKISFLFNDYCI